MDCKKFNLKIISDDKTTEADFIDRISQWSTFDKKTALAKELFKLNKNEVDLFVDKLKTSILRKLERVVILPLHGKESILTSVDEALEYLKKYKEDKTSSPLMKYEILIKFCTGDKIEGLFHDKKSAITFLETNTF